MRIIPLLQHRMLLAAFKQQPAVRVSLSLSAPLFKTALSPGDLGQLNFIQVCCGVVVVVVVVVCGGACSARSPNAHPVYTHPPRAAMRPLCRSCARHRTNARA
jgi:hypothetical protein